MTWLGSIPGLPHSSLDATTWGRTRYTDRCFCVTNCSHGSWQSVLHYQETDKQLFTGCEWRRLLRPQPSDCYDHTTVILTGSQDALTPLACLAKTTPAKPPPLLTDPPSCRLWLKSDAFKASLCIPKIHALRDASPWQQTVLNCWFAPQKVNYAPCQQRPVVIAFISTSLQRLHIKSIGNGRVNRRKHAQHALLRESQARSRQTRTGYGVQFALLEASTRNMLRHRTALHVFASARKRVEWRVGVFALESGTHDAAKHSVSWRSECQGALETKDNCQDEMQTQPARCTLRLRQIRKALR